uniref:vomeronasal type-2 receptor 26-like n=1 Tax=Euleptes europaea TaxID=460621 RepID=UPI002541C4B6|nr:vomeronasal type-2 receptor 26-like [Euleptes europaea]
MVTKFYQTILALVFAIQEINANPHLLPNATLGFHIYDNYHSAKMTYHDIMDLLFRSHQSVPNYRCDRKKNLIAIIGGVDGDSSFHMADILGLYKIPQLTYGSFALERDATEFPQFYLMAPNEAHQFPAIIQLLLYFQWTWIGLLIVDDDSGENFLKTLEPLLLRNGICLAATGRIQKQPRWDTLQDLYGLILKVYSPLTDSKANIALFYGQSVTVHIMNFLVYLGRYTFNTNVLMGRMWIMTGQDDITSSGLTRGFCCDLFQGALSFTIHSREVPGFQKFLHNTKPNWKEGNGFLEDFWVQAFNCSFQNSQEPMKDSETCTGEERLETIPGPLFEMDMTGHSYSIYNAVYAVAHVLNAISTSGFYVREILRGKRIDPQDLQPWQLHHFFHNLSFNNSAGERVSFGKKKELGAGIDITHLIISPNNSIRRVKVGRVDPDAVEEKQFIIHEDLIDWRGFNQVLPISICNDHCYPGFHKKVKEGESCCYDCAPCPEGKFSDRKDMVDCIRCPDDQFPNKHQDQCIEKSVTFLSFEEPLGITSAVLAVSLSLIAALTLEIFVKQRDTHIVKAHNRSITYTLLVSLLICFLCPLLFLGEPRKVTCLFRQAAFTIVFTMAISSVLAKTITVVGAFMATQPGSSLRKWLRKRLTNGILLICSFIQITICMVWLGISPPFPDVDRQTLTREIVAECNEGSVVMFSIALGYLGLLSVLSLIVAFLARKLPDSFNEAKFITFSMLIFCSVWVSFVPTYLSTKGKYMVAVEIFSILASGAGLLGCIFLPKCYIILLKPDLNKKELLISRRN